MGLFGEQVLRINQLKREWSTAGVLRELSPPGSPWPREGTLVLREDTGLELGNPAFASMFLLIWGETGDIADGTISLVGPDLAGAATDSLPFGQVVIAGGSFDNEYDSYRDIRDAVYDTRLDGFSVRTLPSRRSIWCRVSTGALEGGLSLAHLGAALVEEVRSIDIVSSAEVLFVTSSREDVLRLEESASGAQKVIDAMMKMYQEDNFDCESCEYKDVCDSVMDLKRIRDRLVDAKEQN